MRAKIVSDGTPQGTRLLDDNHVEIKLPITGIRWSATVGDITRVEVDLAYVEMRAASGELAAFIGSQEVAEVIFKDGSRRTFTGIDQTTKAMACYLDDNPDLVQAHAATCEPPYNISTGRYSCCNARIGAEHNDGCGWKRPPDATATEIDARAKQEAQKVKADTDVRSIERAFRNSRG